MPSTLPSSGFIEAVNAAGEKQLVPRAWLEAGHRFAGQFRASPSARQRAERTPEPSDNWTVAQLRDYADRAAIDLAGATTKADVLSVIDSAQRGAEED